MPATKRQTATPDRVFERVIDTVETTQSRVIEVNRVVAENLIGLLPTDRFNVPAVPGLAALPTPTEMVDSYFQFADRLNEANHTFSRRMVEAWNADEVAEKSEKAAKPAKAATKTAKKSTK